MTKTQPPPTTNRPSQSRGLAWATAIFVAIVATAGLFFAFVSDRGPVANPPASTVAPPAPTGAPPPTAQEPEGTVATPDGVVPEGTEHLLVEQPTGVTITVTIPGPDWYGEPKGQILLKNDNADAPDGAGLIVFAEATRQDGRQDIWVYGDPCQWADSRPESPVTTVDEAVVALSIQPSRDASAPVDVTIGGFTGKSITLHVPDDADFSQCDRGEFRSYVQGRDGARYSQDPGQIDKLWILDVDGDLLIINTAYYAGTPQVVVDELEAIVTGAGIERLSSSSSDLEIIQTAMDALYSGDADRAAELFELPEFNDDQIREKAAYEAAIGGRVSLTCTSTGATGVFSCNVGYDNSLNEAVGDVIPADTDRVVVEAGQITEFVSFPEHSYLMASVAGFLRDVAGDDACADQFFADQFFPDGPISPTPGCVGLILDRLDEWVVWHQAS